MSKLTIRIDFDFTDGELKQITDGIWSKAEERILSILRKYDRGSGVLTRTISQNVNKCIPEAKKRREILEQLITEGVIELVTGPGIRGVRYKVASK